MVGCKKKGRGGKHRVIATFFHPSILTSIRLLSIQPVHPSNRLFIQSLSTPFIIYPPSICPLIRQTSIVHFIVMSIRPSTLTSLSVHVIHPSIMHLYLLIAMSIRPSVNIQFAQPYPSYFAFAFCFPCCRFVLLTTFFYFLNSSCSW